MSRQVPRRAQLFAELILALRDVTGQIIRLNHTIGTHIGIALADLGILELVDRRGPRTPSELAAMTGLSPATMTGILDRLEHDDWIRRERDPEDRRKVNVSAFARRREMHRYYDGMRKQLQQICADYSEEQLATMIEFLSRVAEAAVAATKDLRTRLEA